MTVDAFLIVAAVLLILLGGLFAGAESALSRVSRVVAEGFVRDGRRGATLTSEPGSSPARNWLRTGKLSPCSASCCMR